MSKSFLGASLFAAFMAFLAVPAQAEVRWSVSIGTHYGHWSPYGWGHTRSMQRHPRHVWGPSLWYAAPAITYVMVAPPQALPTESLATKLQDAPAVTSAPPASTGELVLDARNGQSAVQTQRDRSACMQQASKQPQSSEAAVFQAALANCLQERGYAAR